jgi:hypothetical protein
MIAKFLDKTESNSAIEFGEADPLHMLIYAYSDDNDPAGDAISIYLSYDDITQLIDFLIKMQIEMNKPH